MLGSGVNLVTTIIGFGMSVTFIIFICVRLICGRIRSSDSRAATIGLELRSDFNSAEHVIHGLEPIEVATIPTMKFHREAFHSKEDAQCSICLGEYEDKEILRILPACFHNFHLTCIDLWLQKQSTCPICRWPLNSTNAARLASPLANDYSHFRLLSNYHHTRNTDEVSEIDGNISIAIGAPREVT